ncbi:Ribonuclease [Zea mays]|uniref:Ribonuclease n=1 Tax=Zea mays TaxID=4577 RepID=A0A1D6ITD5_MAIZE|nr:Ribonuclease [Zea mays]
MRNGSGYPRDPDTKRWLEDHKHLVFGFFKDAVAVTCGRRRPPRRRRPPPPSGRERERERERNKEADEVTVELRAVGFDKEVVLKQRRRMRRRRRLGEEERAAILLMALSSGVVYA